VEHLERDVRVCGKMFLQWIVKEFVSRVLTRCTWLRIGSNCGLLWCRNETPGSSKLGNYLTDFMKLH